MPSFCPSSSGRLGVPSTASNASPVEIGELSVHASFESDGEAFHAESKPGKRRLIVIMVIMLKILIIKNFLIMQAKFGSPQRVTVTTTQVQLGFIL